MKNSILTSTQNTRVILPDSLKYIRSDVPNNLTKAETQYLLEQNITTIVDLREYSERECKKCPLIDNPNFTYHCLPVTGGNALPKSVDEVSKSYIAMVDDRMREIVDVIMNATTNVLYFCNAGKDRTGVVSAIILHKMGYDENYIVADYLQSKRNLENMLMTFSEANPDVDINIITPQKRYMEEFLEWIRSKED